MSQIEVHATPTWQRHCCILNACIKRTYTVAPELIYEVTGVHDVHPASDSQRPLDLLLYVPLTRPQPDPPWNGKPSNRESSVQSGPQ